MVTSAIGVILILVSAVPAAERASLDGHSVSAHSVAAPEVPWEEVLQEMVQSGTVHGGLVRSKDRLIKRKGPQKADREISSKDALNELTAQNPDYAWSVSGKTINVLPRDRREKPLSILDQRVKFHVQARSAIAAIQHLLREVKFPASPDPSYAFGGPKPKKTVRPVRDFSCDGVTVIECMNSMVESDGNNFWHIYFDKRLGKYILTDKAIPTYVSGPGE